MRFLAATLLLASVFSVSAQSRRLEIVSGNKQESRLAEFRAGAGRANAEVWFGPLTVRLVDEKGQPVRGVEVRFDAAGPPGMSVLTLGDTIVPKTNGKGEATLKGIRCLRGVGRAKISVSSADASPVILELEVLPPADELPAEQIKISVLSGADQKVPLQQHMDSIHANFQPIRIQLRESDGKPLRKVFVVFSASKDLQIQRGYAGTKVTVQTDGDGTATLSEFAGTSAITKVAGKHDIEIKFGGASARVSLEALPRAGANSNKLEIRSGDGQKVRLSGKLPESEKYPGEARFGPLKVKLVDKAGKPIVGAPIRFSGRSPNVIQIKFVIPETTIRTDAAGEATLSGIDGKSIQCTYGIGRVVISFFADDADPVMFNLEVLPRSGETEQR